jgi:hypothetical protein
MSFESTCKQLLIQGLSAMGLKEEIIPSLIRSMRICYAFDPQMNYLITQLSGFVAKLFFDKPTYCKAVFIMASKKVDAVFSQ